MIKNSKNYLQRRIENVKNVNKERKNLKNKFQRLEKLLPQQNNIIFETEFQDQGQRFSRRK
jgi:hypothetical protein